MVGLGISVPCPVSLGGSELPLIAEWGLTVVLRPLQPEFAPGAASGHRERAA